MINLFFLGAEAWTGYGVRGHNFTQELSRRERAESATIIAIETITAIVGGVAERYVSVKGNCSSRIVKAEGIRRPSLVELTSRAREARQAVKDAEGVYGDWLEEQGLPRNPLPKRGTTSGGEPFEEQIGKLQERVRTIDKEIVNRKRLQKVWERRHPGVPMPGESFDIIGATIGTIILEQLAQGKINEIQ